MKNSLLILLVLLFSSCSTSKYTPLQETIETSEVTYQKYVEPIVSAYCIKCHSGSLAARGLDFTNKITLVIQIDRGNLLSRINNQDSPMPPNNFLPEFEREIFQKWKDNGFQ